MAPHYPQRRSDSETEVGEERTYDEFKELLLDEYGLSTEDYQDLVEFLSRIEPELLVEDTYLILGSYDEDLRNVRMVQNEINSKPSKIAVNFDDLIEVGDNIAMKFRLLAELVDYVILVVENVDAQDRGFEIGLLSDSMYIDKFYILERSSTDGKTEGSALFHDIRSLLEERNQLRRWKNKKGLRQAVHELPGMDS